MVFGYRRNHPCRDRMELELYTVCMIREDYSMKNIYEIRSEYMGRYPEGRFFDPDMMAMYGESLDNMKVTGKGVVKTRNCGDVICYEVLATTQDFTGYHEKRYYFDVDTFELFMPA